MVFVARRIDLLHAAIARAGGGFAIEADVCDTASRNRIPQEAAKALGRIDLFVYASGVSPLVRSRDVVDDDWSRVFKVNTFGAAQVFQACIPDMVDDGMFVYLSSDSVGKPRHGGMLYQASKAAMEEALTVFRVENPNLRFLTLTVGATLGTEIAMDRDPELQAEVAPEWVKRGLIGQNFMEAARLGELIVDVLAPMLDYSAAAVTQLRIEASGAILEDVGTITRNQHSAAGRK